MEEVKKEGVFAKYSLWKIFLAVGILLVLIFFHFFTDSFILNSEKTSLTGNAILGIRSCNDWQGLPINEGGACIDLSVGCGPLKPCICRSGNCLLDNGCSNECASLTTIACVNATHYKYCAYNIDSDACLDWSVSRQSCDGKYCLNNVLVFPCDESAWSYNLSECNFSNQMLRTWFVKPGSKCYPEIIKSAEILSCVYTAPASTYVLNPCTIVNYTSWSNCINGNRTRQVDVTKSLPLGCNISETNVSLIGSLRETCLMPCTSITYSNWSACVNGTKNRNITSTVPAPCNFVSVSLQTNCSLNSLTSSGMVLSLSNKIVSAKLDDVSKVDFFIGSRVVNISKVNISYIEENIAGYGNLIFIKAKNFTYDNKTVYFPRSGDSSGICFVDSSLTEEQAYSSDVDVLYNCTYLGCTGVKRGYSCNASEDIFTIKGLKNSLIIEMFGNICGDAICTDEENCSACSEDCGNCTAPLNISLDTSFEYVPMENVSDVPFEEEVVIMEEDTTPIGTPTETTSSNLIYYLIGGLVLGILVVILLILFYFKSKEKSDETKSASSSVPPTYSMPPTTGFSPRNANKRQPFNPNFPPKQNVPFR